MYLEISTSAATFHLPIVLVLLHQMPCRFNSEQSGFARDLCKRCLPGFRGVILWKIRTCLQTSCT